MAFGGKIDDGGWGGFLQKRSNGGAIPYISMQKAVTRIGFKVGKGFMIARTGELIKVDNRLLAAGQRLTNEVGADKTGTADDNNHGNLNLVGVTVAIKVGR